MGLSGLKISKIIGGNEKISKSLVKTYLKYLTAKLIIPKTLPDEMFKFDLSGIDVSGSFDTSSSQVENEGEDGK